MPIPSSDCMWVKRQIEESSGQRLVQSNPGSSMRMVCQVVVRVTLRWEMRRTLTLRGDVVESRHCETLCEVPGEKSFKLRGNHSASGSKSSTYL